MKKSEALKKIKSEEFRELGRLNFIKAFGREPIKSELNKYVKSAGEAFLRIAV